jgi:hypothetical protein
VVNSSWSISDPYPPWRAVRSASIDETGVILPSN